MNFEFHNDTKIFFGKGTLQQLSENVLEYGKKVLLVYGRNSIKKIGLYEKILGQLKEKEVKVFELSGVEPNPRLNLVNEGIKLCKENGIELVLAVGGGSVIDSAKAIALGVKYNGDVWDFYTYKSEPKAALPVAVILTMAATGSEMNGTSIITKLETKEKKGVASSYVRPKFAILNPEYTYTVSNYQTGAGTVDIMSHIYEFYFNNKKGDYVTARICEAILKTCIKYGPIAILDPENYEARANLMWAGSLALNGLTMCGTEGDGANHGIDHEIGGMYDITHGAGLAIIAPHWMEYILDDTTVDRLFEFAVNVWEVSASSEKIEVAREGINCTKKFYSEKLGMPLKFSEVGIDSSKFNEISEKMNNGAGNFKKLTQSDIFNILNMCK